VPAAAVIPAPIAYIKIAAVKASVVGFRLVRDRCSFSSEFACSFTFRLGHSRVRSLCPVTLSKLECSNQALA
jgi:hypothetical protein